MAIQTLKFRFTNATPIMSQSILLEAADLQNWGGVIIDVRPPPRYLPAHIPDAVNLPQMAIRHQLGRAVYLTESDSFTEQIGLCGIDEHTSVVIYGERGQPEAGYLLWALSYYGHTTVSLLNGGVESWITAGFPLTNEVIRPEQKIFNPMIQESLRAMGDWVYEHLNDDGVTILDNRSVAEYRGKAVYAQKGGHIPSAVHVDWMSLLSNDLRFKPEASLRELFEQAGLKLNQTAVIHCQSGSRSGAAYVALKLIGHEQVRLYDGSWGEWGNHPDTPVE
jgi:thiosulfate/3-mercaptopyruvate sulfurtransferase